MAALARCLNNGQSCIAAKRFIVHEEVYDEFERLFVAKMSGKAVGDPMLDSTDVGPLASEQQRGDIEKLVSDAVAKGARVLCGGAAPDRPGFYYPPTVLTRITPTCACTARRCSARWPPSTGRPGATWRSSWSVARSSGSARMPGPASERTRTG